MEFNELEKINIYKDELLNSVMFNLSLSSKELFHSNFLAYLINNDKTVLKYLFNDYVHLDWDSNVKVQREKYKFDLLISDSSNCLIIENKIKSIPNFKQLQDYEKKSVKILKNLNKKYILLTVYQPSWLKNKESNSWIVLTYIELLRGLRAYETTLKHGYLKAIINDYINFVNSLVKLFTELEMKETDSIYIKGHKMEVLEELRIHDLFEKSRNDVLKNDLIEAINNKYKSTYLIKDECEWSTLNNNDILVNNGFTRHEGILELKIPLESKGGNWVIGLQLQGHMFRMLIESSDKKLVVLAMENLIKNNILFDFSILNSYVDIIESKKNKEYNQFNSVKGLMLYKYKKIKDVSRLDVINMFMEYLQFMIKNKQKITEVCNLS